MSLGPSDHYLWGKWLSPVEATVLLFKTVPACLVLSLTPVHQHSPIQSSTFPPPQADIVCKWVWEGNSLWEG